MEKLTGIPDSDLDLVLGDLRREGLAPVSRTRAADGSWTLTFEIHTSSQDTENHPTSHDNFVAASRAGPLAVLYRDAAGYGILRRGGSRAWRNCNPGNLRRGDFAARHGAIADDGAFVIFPDVATGEAALAALLRTTTYSRLSLGAAINRYAPPSENDTAAYVAMVERDTGIGRATPLASLTEARLAALARAIGRIEGWQEGAVEAVGETPPS